MFKKTNQGKSLPEETIIIEIRPSSLVGAAESVRELYLRMGIMTANQTLYLWDPYSGENDFAYGDRPRKRRSLSISAKAQNKARRDKYRKSNDRRKSSKTGVAGQ